MASAMLPSQAQPVGPVVTGSSNSAPAGTPASPQVHTLKLGYSNVHLIRTVPPVLIDAGSPNDWPELERQLANFQTKPCDIAWVVVTHGHQDHAGLAAEFQSKCATRIAMHQGDITMAAAGGFDPDLKFTRFMSRVVWMFVNFNYPAFKPDWVFS